MLDNKHIVYVWVLFTFISFLVLYFVDVEEIILKLTSAVGLGFLATLSSIVGYYSTQNTINK